MRARASGSSIFGSVGSTLCGQLALLQHPDERVLEGRHARSRRRRRGARRSLPANFSACLDAGIAARRSASRARCDRRCARSAGRPCANRARRPSAAGSRPDTTCPGRNAGSRPARSASRSRRIRLSARARLVGPTAAIFHSALSKSSIETKVGSPPMVSRTSCAARSRSTRSPSASSLRQASSENGLVTRGASCDAVDVHLEAEIDVGGIDRAGDRRGRAIMRRRGERDMALAAEQARGRVEARPSRRPAHRLRPRHAGR